MLGKIARLVSNYRKTSAAIALAASLVTGFEGYDAWVYKDTGGVLTVCYGHTGPELKMGQEYTKEQCYEYLESDLAIAETAVDRLVQVPIADHTKAALISFVYNTGQGAFAKSTLLRKLNRNDLVGACNELSKWVYDNGKKLRGLINRRAIERDVCLGNLEVIN